MKLELAVEQVLVASAEVDERVGDVAAQDGLLDGQVERRWPAPCCSAAATSLTSSRVLT